MIQSHKQEFREAWAMVAIYLFAIFGVIGSLWWIVFYW